MSCVVAGGRCGRVTGTGVEPSSILVFGCAFALTSGRGADILNPALGIPCAGSGLLATVVLFVFIPVWVLSWAFGPGFLTAFWLQCV